VKNHQRPPKILSELGVKIWKNVRVTNYDGRTTTNSDLVFETATVIWTAGVQGAVVAGLDANSLVVERVERIRVNHFSQVKAMMTFCSRRYSVYGNG
jgi:NADH dehydrogenase